ncbi:hypothetical protein DACRYDRAFT_103263 [Dacryopinax primogenitus]|uniref:Uncharacterized protein n=1 Tax=Dacryopinax primogenitus (strain DJM 731) TaxID=1858805 RepID=M5G7Y1_DACPD|nr:uncharacterized protein DACRYDRAFT_103263 [Dacryopinax primogenitus]EJU06316.1 hypothetical protein DACRYDRAFT_103263 [Dacryopinax primogenitus]
MSHSQPPKKLPQIHLMVKTHKHTLALTLVPTQTIQDLKAQAIDALSQFSSSPEDEKEAGFPLRPELGDFEVMRRNGDEYDVLEEKETAMGLRLMAWDRLYLAWRDSKGKLLPVQHDKFSFWGEDDEEPAPSSSTKAAVNSGVGPKANAGAKGKRKMEDDYEPDEDEMDV